MSARRLTLYCDGASRGNPGPSSFGYVISEDGNTVAEGHGKLGVTTNNVAEYQALLRGLEECEKLGGQHVAIRTDSELMVKQLLGKYRVKAPQLLPLFEQAKKILRSFSTVDIQHVRREANKRADELANWALDGRSI